MAKPPYTGHVYSTKLNDTQNSALAHFESLTGSPPIALEDFERGAISANELWQEQVRWITGVYCDVQNIQFNNFEDEDE